jgi:hypothetical protein
MGSFKPTTYLTTEELQQIASDKFEEAAALPDGPQRKQILKLAHSFRSHRGSERVAIQRIAAAKIAP